ncbi:hypothetical protein [Microtetraspora niveoalba]|uniref:hypothetical protein n=1 Tax=Microtetraspora niveoalba TaxID=46175 RepID=UPI00082DB183|nr:hypothetical protein [Microtetraspora niveoalba]
MTSSVAAAVRAVLAHPWGSGPWTAHTEHRYDAECAVCQGDVARVLAIAAPVIAQRAEAERDEARAVAERDITIDSWLYRRTERAEADALEAREALVVQEGEMAAALQLAEEAEDAIACVRALANLPERPDTYDEAVAEYQAVVGSTWDEAYWHAAMSHVAAALGEQPRGGDG